MTHLGTQGSRIILVAQRHTQRAANLNHWAVVSDYSGAITDREFFMDIRCFQVDAFGSGSFTGKH
jgi:hypothetical protein